MQSISYTYGKSVGPSATGVISVVRVTAPFEREFAGKRLAKSGQSSMIPVSPHHEIDGAFYTEQRTAPDNTVIMLQMRETRRGRSWADAAVFLRLRAQGQGLIVRATLPPNENSQIGESLAIFVGRADILSLDELEDMGIVPYASFVTAYMNLDEINACFSIEETAPEIAAAPIVKVVETDRGDKITITETRRVRRMRFRDS